MPAYTLSWGIQRNDEDETIDEFDCYEDAIVEAERMAIEYLDSYGGTHGYPCSEDYEDWDDFIQEAQSWIDYSATLTGEGNDN